MGVSSVFCCFKGNNEKCTKNQIGAGLAGLAGLTALTVGAWCLYKKFTSQQALHLPQKIKAISLDWTQLSSALDGRPIGDPIFLQELNQTAAELSAQMGRGNLSPAELADLINPNVPIDAILKRQRDLGSGAFRQVALFEGSQGSMAVKSPIKLSAGVDSKEFDWWLKDAMTEFNIGLAINHPNVMQVHHFAVKREADFLRAYLVCEYFPGVTLWEAKGITAAQQLQMTRQLAKIFEELKEVGVLAQDLHEGNVMVTPEGVLKFIDLEFWRCEPNPKVIDASAKQWLYLANSIEHVPGSTWWGSVTSNQRGGSWLSIPDAWRSPWSRLTNPRLAA